MGIGSKYNRSFKNRALEEAKETGKEVVGITGTMSPRALDFNNFTPELLAEMTAMTITRGGMKKKDIKAFDNLMKKQVGEDKDFRPVKDWPGIDSPDLRDYIAKAPSRVRKKFMRMMEKQPHRRPDFLLRVKLGSLQLTDLNLIHQPECLVEQLVK